MSYYVHTVIHDLFTSEFNSAAHQYLKKKTKWLETGEDRILMRKEIKAIIFQNCANIL